MKPILLLLAVATAPTAAFTTLTSAALPFTQRGGPDDELHAKLDLLAKKLAATLHSSADSIQEHLAALRAASAPAWSWAGAKARVQASLYAFTARGRALQSSQQILEKYVTDIAGIGTSTFGDNPTIDSFADMMGRVRGITCIGNAPNGEIATITSDAAGQSVITSALNCFCADAWDWASPQHVALFGAIRAVAVNPGGGAAVFDPLIFAVRDALPVMMGASGTCSSACQTSLQEIIVSGFAFAEAQVIDGSTISFPASFKEAVPAAFTTCQCGNVTELSGQLCE